MSDDLEKRVWDALRTVKFPGMRLDIVSFDFVRQVKVTAGVAAIELQIPIQNAPAGERMQQEIERVVGLIPGIKGVQVTFSNLISSMRRRPSTPPARAASAADLAERAARIDQLLAELYPEDEPGAAVLVEKDGQMLLRQGYGMAHLELEVSIQPEMVFRIGSITKSFTAVAILKLVEAGKLALDGKISRYLPDDPTHGAKITLEHLLTHTSGIRSLTRLDDFPRLREDLTVSQLIDLFKDLPADFAPGEKFLYANSGYILLGAILEKVTGRTYADWLAESLFVPLGLTHTAYGADAPIVPGRVAGYAGSRGSYQNAGYLSMTQPYAAGGLISTVDDLARWARALTSGTLMRQDLCERMTTPHRLQDGQATPYGYGVTVSSCEGQRVIEHSGGIHGFMSSLLWMPDVHLAVVILSNNPGHRPDPATLAYVLATLAMGKPLSPFFLSQYLLRGGGS